MNEKQVAKSRGRHNRSLRQLAEDTHIALKSDLSYAAKYAVLKSVAWTWPYHPDKEELFSTEAIKIDESNRSGKTVINEHVVPKSIIINALIERDTIPSVDCIYNYFTHYLLSVLVTVEEDNRLNSLGLRQKMPAEYYDTEHELFGNPWARHIVAGIKLHKRG